MAAAPLLLVVLFDGFGHNLFQQHHNKFENLTKFYNKSAKITNGIMPVFPADTSPNLMSITTGLYAESHGITSNYMYEKATNSNFKFFSKSDEDPAWWDNGFSMPILTLNQLSSTDAVPRFSGGMLWMGSGVPYRGKRIKYYKRYEEGTSWFDEVDGVFQWFNDQKEPANCVFLYFDNPDEIGHTFGTDSDQYMKALTRVDEILGYLTKKIENLSDKLNVIVTADHGMVDIPLDKYNVISELANITLDMFTKVGASNLWNVYPKDPMTVDEVYDVFYEGSLHMNYSVWKREDFPESAHYKNGVHVAPIILLSDNGFRTVWEKFNGLKKNGGHGYNNTFQPMRAFFMAQGPAINESASIQSIKNVDLYLLMCHILKLTPGPNNGSFEAISDLLIISPPTTYGVFKSADYFPKAVGIFLVVLSVFAIIMFSYRMFKKHKNTRRKHKYGLVNDGNPFLTSSDEDDF